MGQQAMIAIMGLATKFQINPGFSRQQGPHGCPCFARQRFVASARSFSFMGNFRGIDTDQANFPAIIKTQRIAINNIGDSCTVVECVAAAIIGCRIAGKDQD